MKTKLILRDIILPVALYLALGYAFYTFMNRELEERRQVQEEIKQQQREEEAKQEAENRLRFEVIMKDTFYEEKQ